MFIYASKKIGTTVYIQHDSLAIVIACFPLSIIPPHFNPFSLQCTPISSPLPPLLTSHLVHTMMSQLSNERICSLRYGILRYSDFVSLDIAWAWYPLRGEALEIFDCVVRGMEEELTN